MRHKARRHIRKIMVAVVRANGIVSKAEGRFGVLF